MIENKKKLKNNNEKSMILINNSEFNLLFVMYYLYLYSFSLTNALNIMMTK